MIEKMVTDFERGKLSRRELIAHLKTAAAGMAAAALVGRAPALAAEGDAGPTFEAKSVDHLALVVTDVARSRDFYTRHLGLEVTADCGANQCFLRAGNDFLALFRGPEAGLHHFSFGIDGYDAGDAVDRLTAAGLRSKRRENRVYFDDPDGLEVQVSPDV